MGYLKELKHERNIWVSTLYLDSAIGEHENLMEWMSNKLLGIHFIYYFIILFGLEKYTWLAKEFSDLDLILQYLIFMSVLEE